jgi:hypothetical protein
MDDVHAVLERKSTGTLWLALCVLIILHTVRSGVVRVVVEV